MLKNNLASTRSLTTHENIQSKLNVSKKHYFILYSIFFYIFLLVFVIAKTITYWNFDIILLLSCFVFRPVDPRSFFRIWLEKIQQKYKEKFAEPEDIEQPTSVVGLCTQSAALSVMAMPVLFDCNRPPKRRTTDIKLKDLQLAKQTFLQPSDANKEMQEVLIILKL